MSIMLLLIILPHNATFTTELTIYMIFFTKNMAIQILTRIGQLLMYQTMIVLIKFIPVPFKNQKWMQLVNWMS